MNVKVVALRKLMREGSRLLGVCQIVLNDLIVIDDIKIIEGPNRKFMAMPSQKIGENYRDFAHSTNIETRELLESPIIGAYEGGIHEAGELDEFVLTNIKVRYLPNATGPVATVTFELNNCMAFHGILIVKELMPDGASKFKFLMPTREDGEGNRKPIYFFRTREFSDKVFGAIFDEYKKGLNNNN